MSASCFSDSGLAWGAGIGGGESGSTGHVKVTGGEVNASCEGNVGYDRGAGIGNGVNGSGTAVEVSGGRVEAAGGSTIEESATVTGGLFGSGNVSDNEVYDVPVGAQDFPCAVIANPDALTAERYPFAVAEAKDYAPSLAPNGPLTYKGSALAASDFTLSATGTPPTEADLMAAAAFSHALQGSPLFEDGLPADAGSYVVKASLAKVVKGTEGSYVCYAALAPAETDVTINRKAVSPTSAAIGPKVYDGTVDAEVQEVSFDGPVDGESLALGEDYAATAAFEDAPAGEDKKVHVSVSLVADGPAAKNYVLKDGTGAFDAAGAITPSGASLGLSASDARPVYGDAIELSVTPDIKKDDANALEVSQPIVEFFVGEPGEGVKIGEAPVEEGKTAKVSLDTASKLLKAGGNVVCARVTGMQNLQDATERTVVTLMPKPVEASWSGVEGRIYGDGLLATAAVSGVLAGDDATSSVKGGDATAAGGPYTATVVLHGEDVGFYALSGATATARYSIARVPLSAQVAAGDPSATRAYDGTAAFAGVALALDGVLAGDEVFATAEGAADGALPAEGRAFSVTRIVLSGASAGNYELAPGNVTGTVSIVKARLAVRAKDASMTTGAALPAFGYEIEGLAAGDEVTVPPAFAVEGDTAVPGTCYVVPSGIEVTHADCYETVYERGLLAVSAAGGGGSTGGGAAGGPTGGPSALAPTGDPLSAALAAGALAALAGLTAVLVALRRRAPRRSS